MALAPSLLGSIAAIVGVSAVDNDMFFWVSFAISLLATIIGWYAIEARQWWWLPLMASMAIVWNPVYPLAISGDLWPIFQYLAAAGFLAAGLRIRVAVHA